MENRHPHASIGLARLKIIMDQGKLPTFEGDAREFVANLDPKDRRRVFEFAGRIWLGNFGWLSPALAKELSTRLGWVPGFGGGFDPSMLKRKKPTDSDEGRPELQRGLGHRRPAKKDGGIERD